MKTPLNIKSKGFWCKFECGVLIFMYVCMHRCVIHVEMNFSDFLKLNGCCQKVTCIFPAE